MGGGSSVLLTPEEQMRARSARNAPVAISSLRTQQGMMRTSRRLPAAQICGLVVAPLSLFVGGILYWQYSAGSLPLWQVELFGLFTALLVGGMSWLTLGLTSYGVAVVEEGILLFDRSISRRIVIRWLMPWAAMGEVKTAPGKVWLHERPEVVGSRGTYLSFEQARAVLTDQRCPLRAKLPAEVAARIGVAPGPRTGSS
jgi:hypothetical protein